jgi:hypothetical protein
VTGDSAPAALRSDVPVRAPADYRVEYWVDGNWAEIADQRRWLLRPEGRRANVVSFPPLRTARLRAVLEHRRGSTSGLSEFEAWGPGDPGAAPTVAHSPNLGFGATVTASYTAPSARLEEVHDMRIAFTRYTRNGWTAVGSPNARDWTAFAFDGERRVEGVDLYLLSRSGIAAPASVDVEYWDGAAWRPAAVRHRQPERPTAWARNRVDIEPVTTGRVRAVFEHARPAATGVAEIVIRGR